MGTKARRLLAAVIDHYVLCWVASFIVEILMLAGVGNVPIIITVFLIVYFSLLIFRDCAFKNASIGKKILKLEILREDGTKPQITDLLKRNIMGMFLFPLEALLVVFNDKRIGDVFSKTLIVCKTSPKI